MFFVEVAFDDIGLLLGAAEVRANVVDHLRLILGTYLPIVQPASGKVAGDSLHVLA